MKLSVKQANLLSNILVSISMTIVMTAGMLYIHAGYCDNFFKLWLNDFFLGCCIAVPTGLIIVPVVAKWTDQLTGDKNIS
jgi:hypothetical protein